MQNSATRHAAIRLQQRAIHPEAINLLLEFGSVTRSNGADSYYFDRTARHRAKEALDSATLRRVAKCLNAYAIVDDDGALITAAWRTRRRWNS